MTASVWNEDNFASRWMTHQAGETFAAPMVTNQWAEAQACTDPFAYRFFSAPPVAMAEGMQAELYLRLPEQDRIAPLHQLGAPIAYRWYPDRVERTMDYDGLRFSSVMTLAVGRDALLIDLGITNVARSARSGLKLFLKLLSGVERLSDFSAWNSVALPQAITRADPSRHAFIFEGAGPAFSVQGTDQPSLSYRASVAYNEWRGDANLGGIVSNRVKSPSVVAGFEYEISLSPDETWRLRYVNALAENESEALQIYDEAREHFEVRLAESRAFWQTEIQAAFTPGNDRFSGHLPSLSGVHESIQRVYRTGALNLLFMKRTGPRCRFGTAYKTISPRSGATFWLWDTQQAAKGLVHLDPLTLRTMAEWYMQINIYSCWGTNYLTGAPLGPWYSVNDYALFTMAYDYLRYSGEFGWLDQRVGDATVLQHMQRCASHWRDLNAADFLADYGETHNLLECVKTYTHKVAALNAANAWMNFKMAEIEERRGDTDSARQRRADGKAIADAVLSLFQPGGYFACRLPDGTDIPVQHAYDFGVVMATIFDQLGPQRQQAMIQFFKDRLQTPSWMRALAADDPAARLSLRTDHTATGAYTSWPAYAIHALCRTGNRQNALWWIGVNNDSGGVAGVALQGPYGQGTFHGGQGSLLEAGAARKANDDPPHYEEWIDVAGGAYVGAILEGVFGVDASLYDGIRASGVLAEYQPEAQFSGLRYQGQVYDYVSGDLHLRE